MRRKHSQEAMERYFKCMTSRAKCIDAVENEDMIFLPVQNLPINNHTQVASQLDSVIAAGFEITKVCVMDQSGSRIAEVWNSYKEEICLSGPEASKLKGIIAAMDKLMERLQNPEDHALKATEFHEKIKSKGSTTQYIMVALLPSRRCEGLFTFCYHYVEAEKGTTPEQLTALLINNNTIGYDNRDKTWRYIMEGKVERGTTPEPLTALLINNNTIGYDNRDKTWGYIMEGIGDDQPKKVQSPTGT